MTWFCLPDTAWGWPGVGGQWTQWTLPLVWARYVSARVYLAPDNAVWPVSVSATALLRYYTGLHHHNQNNSEKKGDAYKWAGQVCLVQTISVTHEQWVSPWGVQESSAEITRLLNTSWSHKQSLFCIIHALLITTSLDLNLWVLKTYTYRWLLFDESEFRITAHRNTRSCCNKQ